MLAAPFFPAVKGTTSGTPGTGAFTPNAAAAGHRAWSTITPNFITLVRYDDGSAWELSYGYWNATTISRPVNGFVASSTGSQLSLTSAATATLIQDGNEIQPPPPVCGLAFQQVCPSNTTIHSWGLVAPAAKGTQGTALQADTDMLTQAVRTLYTSNTTSKALGGYNSAGTADAMYSTTAGYGGFEMSVRFGPSTLPTAPRLQVGMVASAGIMDTTNEPSTEINMIAFIKDSGDTNIQFATNDGSGSATKTDTGLTLIDDNWYEAWIYVPPGGGTAYAHLFNLSSGAIWEGSRNSDMPANGTGLIYTVLGGLWTTTGTAFVMNIGSMSLKTGF